jgi:cysteine-rich repeat protein
VVFGAAILATLALNGLARPASAQVTREERNCITAFNKNLRKVAKTHGKLVKKCLSNFASGRLVAMTPEECIAADSNGKLDRAVTKATEKIALKCPAGLPAFGATQTNPALVRGVLNQFNLMHRSIGPDLDDDLIAIAADARCQSKVGAALLACSDTRMREFLKCQKKGLKSGQITDGASLASECLGTAGGSQPDDNGRILSACTTKVANAVNNDCGTTNLLTAFASCNTALPATLTSCLSRVSACEVCLLLNDVDGLVRDCDSMDDGIDNGSCSAECSDGVFQEGEGCDDGNGASGDGCSDFCQVEGGWTCTGEPSVCTENCGNGVIEVGELCDDGDQDSGDGCSATCNIENGFTCTGQPSVCVPHCGDSVIDPGQAEVCDDGNQSNGDGCSSTCAVEGGYNCSGEPSVCTFVCGNGTFQAGETCDDNNTTAGDGCSSICKIETGWLCSSQPSLCAPICGDGLKRGIEACDDGDATSGDGCSLSCQVESGFACSGIPSVCSAVCGDGLIRGAEICDDANTASGDGCSFPLCRQEFDYACAGQNPSVCVALCGDGDLDGIEECDDGPPASGDGCDANCKVESGYACFNEPSLCSLTCGNSIINLGEQCDDGNLATGDGCTSSCKNERGWLCTLPGFPCENFAIFIDAPTHGVFTTATSTVVSGHYTTLPVGTATVLVNGVPASTFNPIARTFSHTVSLSEASIFNPILVTLTNTLNGDQVRDRIVVIRGNSVADGAFSPMSVALRLNDSGLDAVEPLVAELAGGGFDVGALLPPGSVITDSCFIDTFLGCLGSARVTIASPAPSTSGFTLGIDSKVGSVFGDIDILNLRIDVNIEGSGLVPNCGLRMTASALQLTGNYSLEPKAGDPSNIDVNLITPISPSFSGFNTTFTSGLCDAPIIGDIIQALLPDVQQLAVDGIGGFVDDPDGAGPLDSPIADGIEDALAGINITGPVGEGVGLMLESPLFTVAEDNAGITLGSDSRFTVSVGGGPGQCIPPAGAPNFTRSYSTNDPFPSFGANTPVGGNPYGLGICISAAGFNQLMRGQVECGLMISALDEIDLDGSGPLPPLALDSTVLSALVPEFGQLPAGTPLQIRIRPTLAPIVTGAAGPGGELTELKLSHLLLEIVDPGPNTLLLSGAIDAPLGMNLAFLPDGSGLAITVNPPAAASGITVAILENPLGVNVVALEALLPGLVQTLIPDLAGALSGFPLPQFFGLNLQGVEVTRNAQFLSLFANLTEAP